MSQGSFSITINLRTRRLTLYKRQQVHGSYPVAIGKPNTPSPIGTWSIVNKILMDGRKVYGTRWMGLSKPRYGIHGTNNPNSIGKSVSLGCIRMYNHDVEQVFSLVSIGTPVEIFSTSTKDFINTPILNPSSKTYVVRQGDSLWAIAIKTGIPLPKLIDANPQIDPNLLYPGQIIYLQ
ncbi:MAG: L,D-transpeptidase family protein [Clostridia bacterium]|nr:L,D-transpeptidase family protein [Clostridia bacterium]MDD4047427.1 L,D-transpeptidase family protein [Clostridia bacterium]